MTTLFTTKYKGLYVEADLLRERIGSLPVFVHLPGWTEKVARPPLIPHEGNAVLLSQYSPGGGIGASLIHSGDLIRVHVKDCLRLSGCLCETITGVHRSGCPELSLCKCVVPPKYTDDPYARPPLAYSLFTCVPYTFADDYGNGTTILASGSTVQDVLARAQNTLISLKQDRIQECILYENPVVEARTADMFQMECSREDDEKNTRRLEFLNVCFAQAIRASVSTTPSRTQGWYQLPVK